MPIERRTTAAATKRIAPSIGLAILFVASSVTATHAQIRPGTARAPAPQIRQAIETARFELSKKQRHPAPHAVQGQLRPATRGMWVAVGAVTGAVALASTLAAAEEGDNEMRGVVIGLPVGALLGGMLTWRLTR